MATFILNFSQCLVHLQLYKKRLIDRVKATFLQLRSQIFTLLAAQLALDLNAWC